MTMKFFLLLQISLFFYFSPKAQNWQIINQNDHFNYVVGGSNLITTTIYPDSFSANGSDTTWYLNRIYCDTCFTVIGGPNVCDTCYGLKNQPQFLQRYIVQYGNGIYNLKDTGNFIIQTLAGLGNSWLFDSTNNIFATVIITDSATLFGTIDSIKLIVLSTSDTIVLSKQFGIIRFPFLNNSSGVYSLAGIEGRNVGSIVPGFWEIFNFDPGDMFEYWTYLGDGSGDLSYDIKTKYVISSKTVFSDSVKYAITGKSYTHAFCLNPFVCNPISGYYYLRVFNDTLTFIDSLSHISNRFNNELVRLDSSFRDMFDAGQLQTNYSQQLFYGPVLADIDSNGVFRKYLTLINPEFENNLYFATGSYHSDSIAELMIPCDFNCNAASLTAAYGKGLGQIYWGNNFNFETTWFEVLRAYRKGLDTIGTFTPDSQFFISVNEVNAGDEIFLFPNPADKQLMISGFKGREFQYILYTIYGEVFRKGILMSGDQIDVSTVPEGFYILRLVADSVVSNKKIVIRHFNRN